MTLFEKYKEEAETYFVTKLVTDDKGIVENAITKALRVIYNVSKVKQKKRGVVIHSEGYGQGKTLFFTIVHHRIRRKYNRTAWVTTSAKELCKIFATEGQEGLQKYLTCRNLFIDDLGKEQGTSKFYGHELNVLSELLAERYDLWLNQGYCTYMSTNLNIDKIAEGYGGFIADRLVQMCEFISFDFLVEGSFRQITSARMLSEAEKPKDNLAPSDHKKHDAEYYRYLNICAADYHLGVTEYQDRFWLTMHDFFERKGYNMPEATEEQIKEAQGIKNDDLETNPGRGHTESAKEVTGAITKVNNSLHFENQLKAIIGRDYFTKLAKEKHIFSESTIIR